MASIARAAWLLASFAAFAAAAVDSSRLTAPDLEPLEGDGWTGTLVYLDYGTGQPVSIRSTLVVKRSVSDPSRWEFEVRYPDEPDESSREEVAIGDEGRTLAGDSVIELQRPDADRVIVVTETRGTDNGQPATIRHVYEIASDEFSLCKQVRFEGVADYIERSCYRWSR